MPFLQHTRRQELALDASRVVQVCVVPRMLPEQIPPLRAGERGVSVGQRDGWMDAPSSASPAFSSPSEWLGNRVCVQWQDRAKITFKALETIKVGQELHYSHAGMV